MTGHHLQGVAVGIVGLAGGVAGAALAVIWMGFAPMAADIEPSALESRLAMKALHAISEREMGRTTNPLPVTDVNLAAGLKIYRDNCIMCHGAADGSPSRIAAGFYVPAPQFAKDGAEDDPEGATYWKIRHGIRFSAMPAFQKSLSDDDMWRVAMFVKRMDALPRALDEEWKATKGVGAPPVATPAMRM